MALLKDYHHFDGLAFATGYPTNALAYQGVKAPHTGKPYTEAMLMGINGGLCAGYFSFSYEGWDPHLHFLTRYLFDEQPGKLFEHLAIPMNTRQTTDPEKAVANVINGLAQGKPVIVWLDMASLPYNVGLQGVEQHDGSSQETIWMVMPLLVYGYDQKAGVVHVADRSRVGLTITTEQFAKARARINKTKHRIMTIDAPNPNKLPGAIVAGINACIDIFTGKPPVSTPANFGFEAYKKWAKLLTDSKNKKSWAKEFATGPKMFAGLTSSYRYTEVWFTGGRGARDIYADFLIEAADVLGKTALRDAAKKFHVAADRWGELTTALLPDAITPFKEARELLKRSYDLFMEQGEAANDERRELVTRYNALRQRMKTEFPLSEAEAVTMRAGLADRVMAVHDAEVEAISALQEAVR